MHTLSRLRSALLALVLALAPTAAHLLALDQPVMDVKGQVVDLECALGKGATARDAAHASCAMQCAKDGKAMALMTDDAVYVIDGDYTANGNARLLDFVGKTVIAKGTLRERDGRTHLAVASMTLWKP